MLNDEWRQLHDEINRITATTRFNGRPLLNQFDPELAVKRFAVKR